MKTHMRSKVAGSRLPRPGHLQRMCEERLTHRAWKTEEGVKRRRGKLTLRC